MALHESEQVSWRETTSEACTMRRLAQSLYDAIVNGLCRKPSNIITLRAQVVDAPQKIRVQSKG